MFKRAACCVVASLFAALSASAASASDFGFGFGSDSALILDDAQIPDADGPVPGFSLIMRYALVSASERSFMTTELTVGGYPYRGYRGSNVPPLLYRGRALWGWRFGWRVPLDLSAGLGGAIVPEETCAEPRRQNCSVGFTIAPLPTGAVGTGWGGERWEFNLTVRMESLNPSLQIGLLWW